MFLLKKIICVCFCLMPLYVNAIDRGYYYYPPNGGRATPLFQVDENNSVQPIDVFSNDSEEVKNWQWIMKDEPNTETPLMFDGPNGPFPDARGGSVFDVLDTPGDLIDLKPDGTIEVVKQERVCPTERRPLGILLFCLDRQAKRTRDGIAHVRALLVNKPNDRKLKDLERTLNENRGVLVATKNTLARAHHLPLENMRPYYGTLEEQSDENVNGTALRQGTDKSNKYFDPLFSCMMGYREQEGNDLWPSEVCRRLKGKINSVYTPEIQQLMLDTTVYTYYELLRMEAITRTMNAHRLLTGEDIDPKSMPGRCGPFESGMRQFKKTPKPPKLTDDPAYRQEIKQASLRVKEKALEAREIAAALHEMEQPASLNDIVTVARGIYRRIRGEEVPAGTQSRAQVVLALRNRLEQLEGEITSDLAAYPHLAPGHGAREKAYHNLPSAFKFAEAANDSQFSKILKETNSGVSKDIIKGMKKFCSPPTNLDWEELIQVGSITDAVTEKFPQFKFVQKCASEKYARQQRNRALGTSVLKWMFYPVGGVGAVIDMGTSIAGYFKARKQVDWKYSCMRANAGDGQRQANMCSSSEYNAAAQEYDDALASMLSSVVELGLEGPEIAKMLPLLVNGTVKLKKIEDLEKVKTLIQKINDALAEAVKTKNAAGTVKNTVSTATEIAGKIEGITELHELIKKLAKK